MKEMNLRWFGKGMLCVPLLLAFGCASFELTSVPIADIYENGEKVASTPYHFDLLTGQRSFTLKCPGYVEVEIFISPLDPKHQHYPLEWVGRTRIETLPGRATVLQLPDRKKLGVTPCGLHLSKPVRVLIEKKGFEPIEYDLVPNERYVVELKPLGGFKSAFYREINFVSDQGPVSIYDRVAGERIGTTPVQLSIEAGSALEYRLEGFESKPVLISKKGPRRVNIKLDPITTVTLRGPAGASVYRAGGTEPLGKVPYTTAISGDTLFEVRKEGFYNSSIAVAPGSASGINVALKKIPYKTIVTTPAGAEIYRLGGLEKLGESPYTTIVDSERVFEIKKKGFRTSIIGMGSGSPAQLNVPLAAAPRDDPDAAALGELDSPVISTY
jgi:hypothetical protein